MAKKFEKIDDKLKGLIDNAVKNTINKKEVVDTDFVRTEFGIIIDIIEKADLDTAKEILDYLDQRCIDAKNILEQNKAANREKLIKLEAIKTRLGSSQVFREIKTIINVFEAMKETIAKSAIDIKQFNDIINKKNEMEKNFHRSLVALPGASGEEISKSWDFFLKTNYLKEKEKETRKRAYTITNKKQREEAFKELDIITLMPQAFKLLDRRISLDEESKKMMAPPKFMK